MSETNLTATPLICLGKIGAPYGVKGWLHVRPYTEDPHTLLTHPHWQVTLNGKTSTLTVAASKAHGDHLVVKFEGCDDREAARALTHSDVTLPRDVLPDLPPNTYYWADLEGLRVIDDATEAVMGKIDHLFNTGANDVIVVTTEGEDVLIPYLYEQTVLSVDTARGEIRVAWEWETEPAA